MKRDDKLAFEFVKGETVEYLNSYFKNEVSRSDIEYYSVSFKNNLNNKALSNLMNQYVSELFIANDSLSENLEYHKNKIATIIIAAESDTSLTGDDVALLKALASVAIKSHEYWDENFDDWYSLFNGNKVSNEVKAAVVDADIDGALQGAITGLVTGGGIGALLGACLGAPLASAWTGLKNL